MSNRLVRRLVLPLAIVAAAFVGTAGTATAAPPAGPVASAPIHIFGCSSQGTYFGIWVNQRLAYCVANAGSLGINVANVAPYIRSGNNAGYYDYYPSGSSTSKRVYFGKYQTVYTQFIRMYFIHIN